MKRLQFVVKDEVYDRLLDLRQQTEANSLSEVFRDALRAYAWMVSEYAEGREIVSKPEVRDLEIFSKEEIMRPELRDRHPHGGSLTDDELPEDLQPAMLVTFESLREKIMGSASKDEILRDVYELRKAWAQIQGRLAAGRISPTGRMFSPGKSGKIIIPGDK